MTQRDLLLVCMLLAVQVMMLDTLKCYGFYACQYLTYLSIHVSMYLSLHIHMTQRDLLLLHHSRRCGWMIPFEVVL
jgi:hypothetical protein